MSFPKVAAVVVLGAGLAACASGERFNDGYAAAPAPATGSREAGGTAAGAIIGAVVGSQFGGGVGERVAAGVAGAAIGGLIGNRIGAALDDEDRQRAYMAQMDALERGNSGAPVAWENPDSGRRGTIVPGPAYDRRGTKCREFTHTVYIDGRPQIARGAACRNPDGTWTPLA
jgi:surface antigen